MRTAALLALSLLLATVVARAAAAQECEGAPFYFQAPDPGLRFWSQLEICEHAFIQMAESFPADGSPVSGFRWWGAYQHSEDDVPPRPEAFVVEIYDRLGGEPLAAHWLEDFEEFRDPTQGNWTTASYCGLLPELFTTDPNGIYYVSIYAVLCRPYQWNWMGSREGEGGSFVFAPVFGNDGWEPVPEDLSLECIRPEAGVDITKTDPTWMPREGNTTTYTARTYWLLPRGGGCFFPGPPKHIRFHLLSTSSERGYCLNDGTRTHTDLHFDHEDNSEFVPLSAVAGECDLLDGPHYHIDEMRTVECVVEATITVVSEDYGSFGMIESSADGCNPIPVRGLLPREPGGATSCTLGPPTVVIPRDDDGNQIADIWVYNDFQGTSPTWDDEDQPNPESRFQGDGLTRYEEYRGVVYRRANGTLGYQRLRTDRKEIAVYRENTAYGAEDIAASADVIDVFADGINGALHDGVPGTINPGRGPRIFNLNRTSNTIQDQHGLWLAVSGGDGAMGNWGLARNNEGGTTGPIGPPRANGRIEVYSDNIRLACAPAVRLFRFGVGPTRARATWQTNGQAREDEIIRDIIGHEMGHGHGQFHHTDSRVLFVNAPPSFRNINGNPFSGPFDETSANTLANCVMQYSFHEIDRSLELRYDRFLRAWLTRDPDWTPGLPANAFGYGAGCTTVNGHTCNTNSHIKD